MIFRRRQDEMEGFRRMREALRQQADPQDHALLDEQDEDEYAAEDEPVEDELVDEDEAGAEEEYEEDDEAQPLVAQRSGQLPAVTPAPGMAALTGVMPAAPLADASASGMPRPAGGVSMTTIGSDTSWSGTLRSESDVYLEGTVEGTLEVRDTVYIAERATVDARITARAIVVSGQLNGTIACEERLEVTPTGRLSGEIEAGSLVVHDGAIMDGKFKMKSGPVLANR
jgi:cytoskeletal protein CcmA (bactofilin family)